VIVYILVLVAYLALLAGIGLYFRGRSKSAADFAIGGRSVGPWVTALSFVAAYYSSVVIIGGGAFGWRFGLSTLWIGAGNVLVGSTLAFIVMGRRVRRMSENLEVHTLPGFFSRRYDSPAARIFSAAITGLFLIIYNVSVLKGMANAFEVLMDMPYMGGVLLSGIVILFYTAVGGYLAVVWTSFVQAIIMIIALVLLTVFALHRVGGMTELVDRLSLLGAGYVESPGQWGWAGLVSFGLIVSLGAWGLPQLLIRFYSIKSERALRVATVVVTLGAAMAVLPYLCGAIARVLVPDIANPDQAIPSLTRLVLNDWGGALFLAGVLLIIASSLVRDVWIEGLGRALDNAAELKASRITSLAVGLVSVLIALKPPGLVLVLTAFAWAVIASTNLWPLLFGICWRRTSPRATLASMVLGAATALGWELLRKQLPAPWSGLHGFITGSFVALVVIAVGTLLGRPAPPAAIARAWGERVRGR